MKAEKGAVTLYVCVACLFVLTVGIVAYIGATTKQTEQMATLSKLEQSYNQGATAEELYQQYDGGDIIPIYTPQQFAKVGSGEEVWVSETGKFYTFSIDKTYMFYGVPEDLELLLSTLKEEIKNELKIELGTGDQSKVQVGVLTLTKETNQLVNSLTITATAESENGIITYIQPDNNEITYTSGTTSINETYTITSNGTYTFSVVEGNGEISDATIVISNIVGEDIQMSLSTTDWTNQNIDVTVTWPDGSAKGVKEIKIANGNWTRYTGTTSTVTVSENGTVWARVKNGIEEMKTSSITINNIDKTPPKVTAKSENIVIQCGEKITLSDYFTVEKTGLAPISEKVCTYQKNGNQTVVITDTHQIPAGTHTITCTATKEGGASASTTKTITVERLEGTLATDTTIKPSNNSNVQIVIPAGFAPAILEGSGTTTSLPGQSGKVVGIMPSSQWNSITVDQINKGIVVVNQVLTSEFNEYVWVPIPDSSKFARVSWNGETLGTGGYFEDETSTEYINMINSVKTNKGFYIGRNEGTPDGGNSRGRGTVATTYYNDVMNYCNLNLVKNSHLMYGIEWDSTLNWLKDNAIIYSDTSYESTKTMELTDIVDDSKNWGFFGDNQSPSSNNIGNEKYKANNIYDLAGNYPEWTQEYINGWDVVLRNS